MKLQCAALILDAVTVAVDVSGWLDADLSRSGGVLMAALTRAASEARP